MDYLNPYDFLQLVPGEGGRVESSELKRARRRILADFELSGEVALDYKGRAIDKSTALRACDELEDPILRVWHYRVHSSEGLRDFLVEADIEKMRSFPPENELQDYEFKSWLSKYLAPGFDRLLTHSLRKSKYRQVSQVLARVGYIQAPDLERVLQGSRRFFENRIDELRAAEQYPTQDQLNQLRFYVDPSLIEALNAFPDRFQEVRNNFARALADVSLVAFNKMQDPLVARAAIRAAGTLTTDHTTKESIDHLHRQMTGKGIDEEKAQGGKQKSRKSSGRRFSYFPYILAIVILQAMIFGNRACSPDEKREYFRKQGFSQEFLLREEAERGLIIPYNVSRTRKLYDSLNYYKLDERVLAAEVDRPKTGDRPYWQLLPAAYASDSLHRMYVSNKLPFDLILFIEDQKSGNLIQHIYVREGENYWLSHLWRGDYTARIYRGNEWQRKAIKVDSIGIGAFGDNSKLIQHDGFGNADPVDQTLDFSIKDMGGKQRAILFFQLDIHLRNLSIKQLLPEGGSNRFSQKDGAEKNLTHVHRPPRISLSSPRL